METLTTTAATESCSIRIQDTHLTRDAIQTRLEAAYLLAGIPIEHIHSQAAVLVYGTRANLPHMYTWEEHTGTLTHPAVVDTDTALKAWGKAHLTALHALTDLARLI